MNLFIPAMHCQAFPLETLVDLHNLNQVHHCGIKFHCMDYFIHQITPCPELCLLDYFYCLSLVSEETNMASLEIGFQLKTTGFEVNIVKTPFQWIFMAVGH